MSDFGTEVLKRYGATAIVFALISAAVIWGFAHLVAAPGSEVSILWGLVKYTKQAAQIVVASTRINPSRSGEPTHPIPEVPQSPIRELTNQMTTLQRQLNDTAQVRDVAIKQNEDLQLQMKAILKERDGAKRERDEKSTQLTKLESQMKALQRDLETARKTSAGDTDTTFIPTHLRLQFNEANLKPEEIDNANIHWSWSTLTQRVGKECLDTPYGKSCYQIQPRGDKNDFDQETVILVLVFDKPISYKDIVVNFHRANLNWSQLAKEDRFAVISLWPKPANFVFEVNMKP